MAKKRTKQPEPRELATPAARTQSRWGWGWGYAVALVLFVVVQGFRPIASSDLWWELSRGREVFGGSLTPSRDMLLLDSSAEADWLGGVPVFLAYAFLGGHGLMLLRVAWRPIRQWIPVR